MTRRMGVDSITDSYLSGSTRCYSDACAWVYIGIMRDFEVALDRGLDLLMACNSHTCVRIESAQLLYEQLTKLGRNKEECDVSIAFKEFFPNASS